MDELTQNYFNYLEQYQSELREIYGNDWQKEVDRQEQLLRSIPITHATNINYMDSILEKGLLPFSYRGETNYSKFAIFDYDIRYGLDKYVFAKIGTCPSYGPSEGRVIILLDDAVTEIENSFFTFHDLTAILLFNEDNNNPFVKRIIQQYPHERLPLQCIYNILAMTFLKSGKTLDSFLESQLPDFPPAYDPDFQHTNNGDPEIKILGRVLPENFIGFVVRDNQTREKLLNKGISETKIILIQEKTDDKKAIYEFKNRLASGKIL